MERLVCLLLLLLAASFLCFAQDDSSYLIGTSITDVTGPAAESGMMGYAMFQQRTHGIHTRQRARVYILQHAATKSNFVFINLDLCMTMQAVKLQVIETLKEEHPELASLYRVDNVVITATHTHAGPGGYSWYTLYDISTFGWDRKYFYTIVGSIVRGIAEAHANMKRGKMYIASGMLNDSNINRSPSSYLYNPEEERKRYESEGGDTEKRMTVLRLEDDQGQDLGAIAWYAVHCTSMTNTNLLISGDNKGVASYLFEKYMNARNTTVPYLPGSGGFIAAFAQANEGDVSPNTRGPSCPDGSPCAPDSTCGGRTQGCIAKGPGKDEFESTYIIASNQFKKALELYEAAKAKNAVVKGPIDVRHSFIPIANMDVSSDYTTTGKPGHTCRAAMGYSFAAGTTDGPGDFDFKQGMNDTHGNPFWNFIRRFIKNPTKEQMDCQAPKPILLDVGEIEPYAWVPSILPVQLVTIGQDLIINAVPAEFTTMAGRRLKERIKKTLQQYGRASDQTNVVVSGLANAYSSYVTTWEEYQVQRYEAASTLYGPHTLAAYIQEFDRLAVAICKNVTVDPGVVPQNLTSRQKSFNPGVILDTHPIGSSFGAVRKDVNSKYTIGDTVSVEFWGGHPKNDFLIERSFANIERKTSSGWQVTLTDGDWDTKFRWARYGISDSIVTVEWNIAPDTIPGDYRIRHFGNWKSVFGAITPYNGTSSVFSVQKA